MALNSDGELAHALKLAACLLLPEKLAGAWIERLTADDRLYLPSKAIISQRRAALDMGFALLQQSKVQASLLKGVFIYALTDSSPQGGRDYEVTVLDFVEHQHAAELLSYVHSCRQ